MTRILVQGFGAAAPTGWGTGPLLEACKLGASLPVKELSCPGYSKPLRARAIPPASPRPAFAAHPRLRRASPIAHYAVSAALEALGAQAAAVQSSSQRLGIVYCSMSGCVNFSRRFYDETLKDPPTASPMIFPETVFNAPASHLGAVLGTPAINYTLVGDPGTFLQGLALAADWLDSERVDSCLVIGAEELDWLIAEAFDLFDRDGIISEGAGALFLRRASESERGVELNAVTDSYLFSSKRKRIQAASQARKELGDEVGDSLLCDGVQGVARLDHDEISAWHGWPGTKWSVKSVLGEAFTAAAAWQCVAAVAALSENLHQRALVSVIGCNQQAIAARFSLTGK